MSNIDLPCVTANPALLLIEPGALEYSERAAQLGKSHHCVTGADNLRDLFLMRGVFQFAVAVLSGLIGPLALLASAQVVRGQWPKARIMILGKPPDYFEDHLYDDAVIHASHEAVLLTALCKLSEDPWNRRGDTSQAS